MKKILFTLLSAAVAVSAAAGDKNYLRYVDPYIGAGGHGHVFVGACVPFGAIQIGPQNIFKGWDWCSGYHYSDNVLIGFSHTHLSGTGCTDLGDIQIMPFTGDVRTRRGEQDDISNSCSAHYRHENERVSPYFYSLTLDNGIHAELTASRRVAFHKYTFPAGEEARLLINLREGNGFPSVASSLRLVDAHTVVGHRIVKGWAPEHRVYFALKSDRPIAELLVFNDDEPAGRGELEGAGVKGVVCFEGSVEKLALKVAISSVSTDNALENLRKEIPHWNFGKVMTAARDAWEKELERVEITTADERAKRIFYTAMYHTMIAPTTSPDVNCQFRGHDNKIRKADRTNYSTFSCWDTYRALHPWFTIIQSDRVGDMVASMLSICDQQGKLPIWPLIGGETNQMPGYGSVPIFSDAVVKGIRGIDAQRALQCAVQTATLREQAGIGYVLDREYIPADREFEATSKAMEYAVADWGIAAMAHKLGHKETERTFARRARYWKHYFDGDINFIRPKFDDESWLTPYNPFQSVHGGTGYFAEGTGWQYTFFVPQDVPALVEKIGKQRFTDRLLWGFNQDEAWRYNAPNDQYWDHPVVQGNQQSMHFAFLFNYADTPWNTQRWSRSILDRYYGYGIANAYLGDEDQGQMSAWAIMTSIGLFQTDGGCRVDPVYEIASPIFEEVTIDLGERYGRGKKFTIKAHNASRRNIYVQSARLNGRQLDTFHFPASELLQGGELVLEMGPEPNKSWGLK